MRIKTERIYQQLDIKCKQFFNDCLNEINDGLKNPHGLTNGLHACRLYLAAYSTRIRYGAILREKYSYVE